MRGQPDIVSGSWTRSRNSRSATTGPGTAVTRQSIHGSRRPRPYHKPRPLHLGTPIPKLCHLRRARPFTLTCCRYGQIGTFDFYEDILSLDNCFPVVLVALLLLSCTAGCGYWRKEENLRVPPPRRALGHAHAYGDAHTVGDTPSVRPALAFPPAHALPPPPPYSEAARPSYDPLDSTSMTLCLQVVACTTSTIGVTPMPTTTATSSLTTRPPVKPPLCCRTVSTGPVRRTSHAIIPSGSVTCWLPRPIRRLVMNGDR
nr:uncharacterized protein LOC113801037 [Penaeus vannamei]